MVAGGIIGAGSYLLDCFETKKEFNGFNFGASILSGIVCGYIGGAGANQGYLLSDIISGTVPHVLSSSTSNVSYCMIKTEYTASFMYSACTYIGNAFNSFIDYIVGLFE